MLAPLFENDWISSSNIQIKYNQGFIYIIFDSKESKLSNISEIYLVQQKLKCYLEECEEEQMHRKFVCLLDLLDSARTSFIKDQESRCIRSLL